MKLLHSLMNLNEEKGISFRLHRSVFTDAIISTVDAKDTGKCETMFMTPEGGYFLLQEYANREEAEIGHRFWEKKVSEGFVATENLQDNFTVEACLKFLSMALDKIKEEEGQKNE